MGANFTKTASTWAARSILSLSLSLETGIHPEATAHGIKSDEKDIKVVVDVVKKDKILKMIEKRAHRMFPKFTPDPLHKLNREHMVKWIKRKAREYMRSDTASVNDSDTEDNGDPTQVTTDPYSIGLDDLDTTVPPNFKPGEDDPYVFLGDTSEF